ncbi:unnamed protein product [Schistosoma curassoni]|uniref:Transposase n=1 Tax=Schistosoma curassoni TaxID=6186 RepID=A0A183KJQ3_9TREM|nr:unnamed protein product [Schistosoma curassoni]
MVAGDRRLVHTPFVSSGYWSPYTPLVWNQSFPTPLGGLSVSTNPVKEQNIRFLSSQFCKQHPRHEKAVSRNSLTEAIYAWPCERIPRGRADSPHSRSYQCIWGPIRLPTVALIQSIPYKHN